MKYTKYILPILLLLAVPVLAKPVWAMDYAAQITKVTDRLTTTATNATNRQATQLKNVIARADTMITTRITSLNELITRINNDTRLSADEKTSFTSSINTTIATLQALKTKIDADTDLTTARTDTKSIVGSYHVYLTFEPQTRLTIIIDNLQTTATTIQNLVPGLQSLSATLKGEGKDTTAIDAAIADISTQLTNITTLLTQDKTTLGTMVVTSATYQTAFAGIRQDLAKVRADFAQIRHDMATILSGVRSLIPHVSPTLTPKPTI